MGKKKRICDEMREQIRAALAADDNISRVAAKFGVSRQTVRKIRDEKPDEFTTLRHQKKQEHIEKAWEIIDLYMEHLKKPETIQKATPHSSAVVIGTMFDKIYKKRELDLKEQENEIRRRELERKERGLSDEAVDKVVDQFIRALGADPSEVWEGIENERPPEEAAKETD